MALNVPLNTIFFSTSTTLATIVGAKIPFHADGIDRSADLFPTAHSPSGSCRSYAYADTTINKTPPSEAVYLEVGYGRAVVVGSVERAYFGRFSLQRGGAGAVGGVVGNTNFIENAVDFADTRVTVEGRWDPGNVYIRVIDDGPGFSPEILSRIGEPYTTTRSGTPGQGGLGLGVFIAKTMIENSGGVVRFDNAGPQGGAVVSIRWPRKEVEAPPALG